MRYLVAWLVASLLTAPAFGQRVSFSVNEGGSSLWAGLGAGATFAHRFTNYQPVTLSAAQFYLVSGGSDWLEVSLWSSDPATGLPGSLLTRGSFQVPAGVPGYWGAAFNVPITLPANSTFFLALTPGSSTGVFHGGPTPTPYFFNYGSGWMLSGGNGGWSFRLYVGQHGGRAVAFGNGKAGGGGVVPDLMANGWPNTRNQFDLLVTQVPAGITGVFVLGSRMPVPLQLPFATIYASPDATVWATTTSWGTRGHAALPLTIPDDPVLVGLALAAQVLLADPAAAQGVSHSAAVDLLLGG